MQKPDAEGFVNITWPSKNVPHGGVFHSRVSNPTDGQRQLLNVLLEESKLTLALNRKNALALREQQEQRPVYHHHVRRPMIRPRTSRRRSLSEIRESGAFDFDKYRPLKRGEDRELMKEKLANLMTYGDNEEQAKPKVLPARKKPEPKLPTNKEKWNDLVTQIRERTEWLAEMEYLGHAGPHSDIIKDQIAERMRALDALGVDSECSTARSTASGFSVVGSAIGIGTASKPASGRQSEHSSSRSDKSAKKGSKPPSVRGSGRARNKEENVAAYDQLSPLQHSLRRRQ